MRDVMQYSESILYTKRSGREAGSKRPAVEPCPLARPWGAAHSAEGSVPHDRTVVRSLGCSGGNELAHPVGRNLGFSAREIGSSRPSAARDNPASEQGVDPALRPGVLTQVHNRTVGPSLTVSYSTDLLSLICKSLLVYFNVRLYT
jgi:hypothetical protein